VIAASIVLLFVVAAVAFRAVRTATANPVKSLRTGVIRPFFAWPETARILISVSILAFTFKLALEYLKKLY
jgi:hypothetical protein